MSQLIMMIARMDDLANPETLTEVWRQALPVADLNRLSGEHALDALEDTVTAIGWAAMRQLLVEQWRLTDRWLVERFRQEQPGAVVGDGYDPLKVASRLGVVDLPRQVCYVPGADQHTLPGNAGLPTHGGQVTTRGLQEWVCLLPQDLPFGTSARLLGWMTHEPAVVSETQVRRWVSRHGQLIRQAEQAEVAALQERQSLAGLQAQLRTADDDPRRPAAWPAEWNQAVETALAQPEPPPPSGIAVADWERVLAARQAETTSQAAELRRLGPQVQAGEVVASVDEIAVRRPQRRRFLTLGTAYVRTSAGYRYLSGNLETVLAQLWLLLVLCGGLTAKVTLLGDGARWIGHFFQERLAAWPMATLILDWYHCRKKCYELTSLICHGRQAKAELLGLLLHQLWRGQVQEALDILEEYRPQARNPQKLDELITYLSSRRDCLPNYRARRAQRQYIGSAHVEKGNDLLVARRQKHRGMHWSEQTSDALAALRTLMLNGAWDLYWQQRHVLPLAVPLDP